MGDLMRPGDSPKGSSLYLPPHTAHTKGKGYLSIQKFPRVKDFPTLQPGVTHACNSAWEGDTGRVPMSEASQGYTENSLSTKVYVTEYAVSQFAHSWPQ